MLDIQIRKAAQNLARADAARKLRAGTLDHTDARELLRQFKQAATMPISITQEIRELPSIDTLGGREAPPVTILGQGPKLPKRVLAKLDRLLTKAVAKIKRARSKLQN